MNWTDQSVSLTWLSVKTDKTSAKFVTSQTWHVMDPKGVQFVDLWFTIDHHLCQSCVPALTSFLIFSSACSSSLRNWRCERPSPFSVRVYCTRDFLSGLKLPTLSITWMMLWQRYYSKQWFRHEITHQACRSSASTRPLALLNCRTNIKRCSVKLCKESREDT